MVVIGITLGLGGMTKPAAQQPVPVAVDGWEATDIHVVQSLESTVRALVTNTADRERTEQLVLTLYQGGRMVARADAVASDVAAGDSELLTFIPEVNASLSDGHYTYRLEQN